MCQFKISEHSKNLKYKFYDALKLYERNKIVQTSESVLKNRIREL